MDIASEQQATARWSWWSGLIWKAFFLGVAVFLVVCIVTDLFGKGP